MRTRTVAVFAVLTLAALAALPAAAQDAKLSVCVKSPTQAYVFVDGRALGDGTKHNIRLAPGSHEVGVYNYGYKPFRTSVNLVAGEKQRIDVHLEPVGGPVSGPWGRIQIEGAPRHAVLLNGKTPDYLVGHADEFNHDWIWKQELIVPPGTHQVTLLRDGRTTYEQEVSVAANQRVIINAGGSTKTTDWPRGGKLSNLPRFRAGLASATVAVAPVILNSFTATPARIQCEDSSRLAWETTDAVEAWLDNNKVELDGQQLVTPLATTTYSLTAAGPGGRVSQSATVDVNTVVEASLSVNPSEIRYRRIGDRVIEHGTATVTWSTSNASTVTLDPFGGVPASGNRTVQPAPRQTDFGPVNESVNYTLNASNKCGGSATRTAALRITGSIEPIPEVVLQSVFFPTDYPDERNPNLGLLSSQRRGLSLLADGFKKYLEYDPQAKLVLEGNADERRSVEYNRALGQRRAAIVKQFLVDAGIPAANLETTTFGEERNITRADVKQLEAQNPAKPPRARLGNVRGNWLAHNRRVDVVLRPTGQGSLRYYPHTGDDASILWQVPKPARRTVEKNQ
jgi:peptidoglycan-associated lipoprotein